MTNNTITKIVKKYGGSYVITFNKEEREIYSLFNGRFIDIQIKPVEFKHNLNKSKTQ